MPATEQTSVARALVWLRRDLRLHDNAALSLALRTARQVWCAFVFDPALLDPLPRDDRRVAFIHASLRELDAALRAWGERSGVSGVSLLVRHGRPAQAVIALARTLDVQAVVASHDDEPAALERDAQVRQQLADAGIALHTTKDHVVYERSEVLTQAARPYSVYTPYRNAWLARLGRDGGQALQAHPVQGLGVRLASAPALLELALPTLAALGFEPAAPLPPGASPVVPGERGAQAALEDFLPRMARYDETRNFPAVRGPSYLSVHLRFGTVSIRELARRALADGSPGARVWLSELIWRDFYHQILHHHPRVVDSAFKPDYDRIVWESGASAQADFQAWCEGRTGYPLVDASIAQIRQTGYMHNRLRMLVASFLTKDLGIDWRWGEAFFASHLIDYDLAANNGGWQWAASTGCDAQPYFRIFNPVTQSEKFDPRGQFIRRYVPQLAALPDTAIHAPWMARPLELAAAGVTLGANYPRPLVDHDQARERTLRRFAVVKSTARARA